MKPTFVRLFAAALLAATVTAQQTDPFTNEDVNNILEWNDNLRREVPNCARECLSQGPGEELIPPCARAKLDPDQGYFHEDLSDEEMIPHYRDLYNCLCADRIFNRKTLVCVIERCGAQSNIWTVKYGLETALAERYSHCALWSDNPWPKPGVVLEEMCLYDLVPSNITDTEGLKLLEEAPHDFLRNYDYADAWPVHKFEIDGKPAPDPREQLKCEGTSKDPVDDTPTGTGTGSEGPRETDPAEDKGGEDKDGGDNDEGDDADGNGDEEGAAFKTVVSLSAVVTFAGLSIASVLV